MELLAEIITVVLLLAALLTLRDIRYELRRLNRTASGEPQKPSAAFRAGRMVNRHKR